MVRWLMILALCAAPLCAQSSARSADEVRALAEDTAALKLYQADDAALKALSRFKELRELSVTARNSALSASGYEAVGALATLRKLEMVDCASLDDAALKALSRLANLESLRLEEPGAISAAGTAHLAGLGKLASLEVIQCKTLDDDALKPVGKLEALRKLVIDECPRLRDGGVSYLRPLALTHLELTNMDELDGANLPLLKLEGLEVLNLYGCILGDEAVRALGRAARLRTLEFAASANIESFKQLAKCTALTTLTAMLPAAEPGYYNVIAGLASLQSLTLSYGALDDTCTREFGKLTKLRELALAGTGIGDGTLEVIGKLAALQALDISGCTFTAEALKHLADCKALAKLNLAETPANDAGCAHLAKLAKLEKLNLSGTAVGFAGVDALSRLTALQDLDLSYCDKVNDLCLATLSAMKALTYINLRGCKAVSAGKLAELRQALPLCLVVG